MAQLLDGYQAMTGDRTDHHGQHLDKCLARDDRNAAGERGSGVENNLVTFGEQPVVCVPLGFSGSLASPITGSATLIGDASYDELIDMHPRARVRGKIEYRGDIDASQN